MSQAEVKFKEGMAHVKSAEKMITTSLFKWKPDWEGGAAEFKLAATCFKNAKAHEQAKDSFMRAADANYHLGYLYSAGELMVEAASMAKQMKNYEEGAELLQKASNIFLEDGKADRGAETLAKAGEAVKDVNLDKASEYYIAACDLYITEGKEQIAQETFNKTVAVLLKAKKFPEAIDILKKQAQAAQALTNKQPAWRCVLVLVIVALATGDIVEANKRYQAFQSVEGFVASREAEVMRKLLDAYESGEQKKMDAVTGEQIFTFLDPEVIRLVRTIQAQGGVGGDEGDNPLL